MECFLKERDIDSGSGITHIGNVESAILCKRHCQIDIRCNTFVYAASSKVCYLKSRNVKEADFSYAHGLVSGPKYCEKDYEQQGNVKHIYFYKSCIFYEFFRVTFKNDM